jgi:hypothetical protein
MEKKTINILAAVTGVVVGYFLFCKFTKQSDSKSLANATPMGEEDLGEEEAPTSGGGGGGGGGIFGGSTPSPVMGTPVYQNYPAPLPPITINTPPPIVYSKDTFGTSPINVIASKDVPNTYGISPISNVTATNTTKDVPIVVATKDIPTPQPIAQTTKPMVSQIINPITAAKFSGFMEFDGNDKFLNELL